MCVCVSVCVCIPVCTCSQEGQMTPFIMFSAMFLVLCNSTVNATPASRLVCLSVCVSVFVCVCVCVCLCVRVFSWLRQKDVYSDLIGADLSPRQRQV